MKRFYLSLSEGTLYTVTLLFLFFRFSAEGMMFIEVIMAQHHGGNDTKQPSH